eukprot:UN05106
MDGIKKRKIIKLALNWHGGFQTWKKKIWFQWKPFLILNRTFPPKNPEKLGLPPPKFSFKKGTKPGQKRENGPP